MLCASATLAAPCKNAKGKFAKCPETPAPAVKCKNAKGQFAKYGTPGAKRSDVCNHARLSSEPKTLITHLDVDWLTDKAMDNRFNPGALQPKGRLHVMSRLASMASLNLVVIPVPRDGGWIRRDANAAHAAAESCYRSCAHLATIQAS